jgi:hypothetical protein
VSVARGHSGALAVRSRLTRPELTVSGAGLCCPADSLLIGEQAARSGAWRRLCYAETKPSLRHAGHLTTLGSSSSNHERPHSQRILYTRCAVTAPNSSSWTSIPPSVSPPRRCTRATGTLDRFLVAVCGGTTFRLSRRPSWRKLPRWVLRSFTTKTPLVSVFRTGWWRHGSKRIR